MRRVRLTEADTTILGGFALFLAPLFFVLKGVFHSTGQAALTVFIVAVYSAVFFEMGRTQGR